MNAYGSSNFEIIKLVSSLPGLTLLQLKALWDQYSDDKPISESKSVLIKQIAFKIQLSHQKENLKDVDRENRKRINKIIEGQLSSPVPWQKLLRPGVVITRKYKGNQHQVLVRDNNSYEYEGALYKSLTAVSLEITGKRWNGADFFNLKKICQRN